MRRVDGIPLVARNRVVWVRQDMGMQNTEVEAQLRWFIYWFPLLSGGLYTAAVLALNGFGYRG